MGYPNGHLHKNYERKRQALKRNPTGRPRKLKLHANKQVFNPLTTISVPFGYKIKRLHSLPQTSNCGDLIVLDNAKVKWLVVSAVAS